MAETLLESAIPGSIISIRYFNGRLLTGQDLTRDQIANLERQHRLTQALGHGVVDGLQVEGAGGRRGSAVLVRAGRAISEHGRLMALEEDTILHLQVPDPAAPPNATRGEFHVCAGSPLPTGGAPGAPGLYLLLLRPLALPEGVGPVAWADRSSDPCTADRLREAVGFHLIRLRALEAALVGQERSGQYRNRAAHLCLSAPEVLLPDITLNAACAVPLALLCLDAARLLRWVDSWAVRRGFSPARGLGALSEAAGPRALAEAEARLMQFESDPPTVEVIKGGADLQYAWLPPAATLPRDGTNRASWRTFLGAMAPSRAQPLDPGLLPAVLAFASLTAPIEVGADLPAAVDVYTITEARDTPRVLYVRSSSGRIRARLVDPAGEDRTADDRALVYAAGPDGRDERHRLVLSGDRLVSPNLAPGAYRVTVQGGLSLRQDPGEVRVVGGCVLPLELGVAATTGTLEVAVTQVKTAKVVSTLQAGPIDGDPRVVARADAAPGVEIPLSLAQHIEGPVHVARDLAPGAYTVTVTATGYGASVQRCEIIAAGTSHLSARLCPLIEAPSPSVCFTWPKAGGDWIELRILTWVPWLLEQKPALLLAAGFSTMNLQSLESEMVKGKAAIAAGGEVGLAYAEWRDPPVEVQRWLLDWCSYYGVTSQPVIRLAGNQSVQALSKIEAPDVVEAFVYLGDRVIPLVVRPGIPWVAAAAAELSLLYATFISAGDVEAPDHKLPSSYTELRHVPKPVMGALFNCGQEDLEDICALTRQRVSEERFAQLSGLSADARSRLAQLDAITLANMSPTALREALGCSNDAEGRVMCTLLVESARAAVPSTSWSLRDAGLDPQGALATAGLRTLGDVARASSADTLTRVAGDAAATARVRDGATATLSEARFNTLGAVVGR